MGRTARRTGNITLGIGSFFFFSLIFLVGCVERRRGREGGINTSLCARFLRTVMYSVTCVRAACAARSTTAMMMKMHFSIIESRFTGFENGSKMMLGRVGGGYSRVG